MEFTPGQNGPLPGPVAHVRVAGPGPVDPCVFVVDDTLRVASSDDVVFYNRPRAVGVRLDGDTLVVDTGAVRPGARVLCAVGTDAPAAVTATVESPSGAVLGEFRIRPEHGETALLCWEFYRHKDVWKMRALGQGYAGGLREMFVAHGVEVDDPAPEPSAVPPPAPATPQTPAAPTAAPASEPLPSFEWLWRVFEDAARSAAGHRSGRDYAQHRLDQELSAAVADPATRTGGAAESARAAAQRRHDDLVAASDTRRRDDSTQLTAELRDLDARLPAALASWAAPSWYAARTPSDGIRVGELSSPDGDDLRVPLCLRLPLDRPLWVAGDGEAAHRVVIALALRLLAAHPGARLDIVDPAGALTTLREVAAPVLAGPPVLDAAGVSAKLRGLADGADLETLAAAADPGAAGPAPRVLVLPGVPHGYGGDDFLQLVRLLQLSGPQSISVVLSGSETADVDDPGYLALYEHSQLLPAEGEGRFTDPWTGGDWTFTSDAFPADAVLLRRVAAALGGT
ncbi:MAG: TerD family protein [Rhodococcus sp.]|uniref:TerD family protein n=1 Tax=Rhodococcus sp. TaxID=1831 RepID=UPI0016BAF0D5|nr:TerD family protein [Rhodococcus sp. (in: high G+C Gram-positive bacteria)]NLV81191.1 TerD family protein [Rhodococcus sp. (in: high G+C Gram-positive bacteria)]